MVTEIRLMKQEELSSVKMLIKWVLGQTDGEKSYNDLFFKQKEQGSNYVAFVGKELVGTIGCWRNIHQPEDVWNLDWFVVLKSYQRKGIGSLLFAYLLHDLKMRKARLLCAERSSSDRNNEYFYAHHEFEQYGLLPSYWEDGGDLILMSRNVQNADSI